MFENTTNFDFDDDLTSSFSVKKETKDCLNKNSGELTNSNLIKKIEPVGVKQVFHKPLLNTRKVVERKFPGPAGILPDKLNRNRLEDSLKNEDDNFDKMCSQRTYNEFQCGIWPEILEDLKQEDERITEVVEKYNIDWIKKQAFLKRLINHKAPFLVAAIGAIDGIEGKNPTVNLTLKDSSGTILATILSSFYEQHSDNLEMGSIIVLKHFAVFSTNSNKTHCLTIGLNNVLRIYKPSEGQNKLLKIVLQPLKLNEIMNLYNNEVQKPKNKPNLTIHDSSLNLNLMKHGEKNLEKCKGNKFRFKRKKSNEMSFDDCFGADLELPDDFEEVALSQVNKAEDDLKVGVLEENKEGIKKSLFEDINDMDAASFLDDF